MLPSNISKRANSPVQFTMRSRRGLQLSPLSRPEIDGFLLALKTPEELAMLAEALAKGPLTEEARAYLLDVALVAGAGRGGLAQGCSGYTIALEHGDSATGRFHNRRSGTGMPFRPFVFV
jgi:hypothetical protein